MIKMRIYSSYETTAKLHNYKGIMKNCSSPARGLPTWRLVYSDYQITVSCLEEMRKITYILSQKSQIYNKKLIYTPARVRKSRCSETIWHICYIITATVNSNHKFKIILKQL